MLLFFSASMIIFQMSCSKEADANNNNTTQSNKIAYVKSNSTTGAVEFWTANLDGTSQTLVPVTIPSNRKNDNGEVTITPDGSKLVFQLRDISSGNIGYIYTCNIDGSNLTQIIGNGSNDIYYSISAY